MGAVNRFCHRAVLLERGEIVAQGEPEHVANHYLELNFNRDTPEATAGVDRMGNGTARIVDAWCETDDGAQSPMYLQGQTLRFCARVEFVAESEDPGLTVEIENEDQVKVLVASTAIEHERSGRFAAGEEAVFSVEFTNVLAPGRYFPVVTVSRLGRGLEILDRSTIRGVLIWRWLTDPEAGGLTDTDFTVQGKPAEHILMCAWTRICSRG